MRLPVIALAAIALVPSLPASALNETTPLPTRLSAASHSSKSPAGRRAATKLRKIDINSASAEQLATLPGINGDKARQIIAGRPYGSKTWLVTHQIIDRGTYGGIKSRIEAKQPYRDARKNAETIKKPRAQ